MPSVRRTVTATRPRREDRTPIGTTVGLADCNLDLASIEQVYVSLDHGPRSLDSSHPVIIDGWVGYQSGVMYGRLTVRQATELVGLLAQAVALAARPEGSPWPPP